MIVRSLLSFFASVIETEAYEAGRQRGREEGREYGYNAGLVRAREEQEAAEDSWIDDLFDAYRPER